MNREELLEAFGAPIKVLDHGHVRLVDLMGNDDAIVQAARVSYGAGVTKRSEDRGLIRYLMRHRHSTPFEMCEIKLHVKLPVFVARQWIRHRTANVNELSGRYSKLPNEFYVPEPAQVCIQSKTNKQGRAEPFREAEALQLTGQMRSEMSEAFQTYEQFCEADMARETARMGLPVSHYTEWYWKIDLHNLLHFQSLRLDEHAQWEIRQYANVIWKIIEAWCPVAAEAFLDFRLEAKIFSKQEMAMLRDIMADWKSMQDDLADSENKDPTAQLGTHLKRMMDDFDVGNGRERIAFLEKLGLA